MSKKRTSIFVVFKYDEPQAAVKGKKKKACEARDFLLKKYKEIHLRAEGLCGFHVREIPIFEGIPEEDIEHSVPGWHE